MEAKNPTKGLIAYLSRSEASDIYNLKRSLSLLDANFNDRFKYPVIIFHEDFDEKLIKDIQKCTHSNLRFERIQFKIPSFLNRKEIPKIVYSLDCGFTIGYRHMCRFMSGLIFQHPAVRDYCYLWRLDTDSFLLDKIDYDVFELMKKNDYIYGYICILKEVAEVVTGLWEATKTYIEENNIKPTFLNRFLSNGVWDRSYYYTNFEISKIDFWRSDGALSYFNYLDKTGGIYKYRWGDHVIHLLTIAMFVPENKVHQFSDIAYNHGSVINNYSKEIEKVDGPRLRAFLKRFISPVLKLSRKLRKRSKLYRKLLETLLPNNWLRSI